MASTEQALKEIVSGADMNMEMAVKCARQVAGELQHDRRYGSVIMILDMFIKERKKEDAAKALRAFYAASIQ